MDSHCPPGVGRLLQHHPPLPPHARLASNNHSVYMVGYRKQGKTDRLHRPLYPYSPSVSTTVHVVLIQTPSLRVNLFSCDVNHYAHIVSQLHCFIWSFQTTLKNVFAFLNVCINMLYYTVRSYCIKRVINHLVVFQLLINLKMQCEFSLRRDQHEESLQRPITLSNMHNNVNIVLG